MKPIQILCLIFFFSNVHVFAQNVGIGTPTPTAQLHTTQDVRFEGLSGNGSRIIYTKPDGTLFAPSSSGVYDNNSVTSILDNTCIGQPSNSITVNGQSTSIVSSAISVTLNITHTFVGDLSIFLTAPNGDVLCLVNNNGGNGDDFFNTVFTDSSTVSITTGIAPFGFPYRPNGSLVTVCGITSTVASFSEIGGGTIDPNGIWNLKIFDNSNSDIGVLNNWSISFVGSNEFDAVNNYFPKWNNGSLTNTSKLYDNGSFIGLGTTAPVSSLHIVQKTRGNSPTIQVENLGGAIANASTIFPSNAGLIIENNVLNAANYSAGVLVSVRNCSNTSIAFQGQSEQSGKTAIATFIAGQTGPGSAYGVYASASRISDQNTAYGIYGSGFFGNYAGYFSGNVTVTGTLANPSDEKLKTNIKLLSNNENILDKVLQLKPVTYDFKKEYTTFMSLPAFKQYGFTAQNIEAQFPELITKNHQPGNMEGNTALDKSGLDYKAVNYIQLIPILTQAIQEQQVQIDQLKVKNEILQKLVKEKQQAEIDELKLRNELLQKEVDIIKEIKLHK